MSVSGAGRIEARGIFSSNSYKVISMDLKLLPLQATFRSTFQKQSTSKPYLMIVLHGRGDSPSGFAFLPDGLAIPQLDYLMLQAPDPYFDGFSWYELPPNQLPGVLRSRKLLETVLTQTARAGYPPDRTFLFGFSQGCLMTLEFGARYPHRLAGYLGISGYALDTDLILREMSSEAQNGDWLVIHGTHDGVLPVERTREQVKALQAGGLPIEYREFEKDHTILDEGEIPFISEWVQRRIKAASKA